MTGLKLYSSLLSANGRKVLAVCCALEIDITIEEVNVYAGQGNSLEYLKINPLGQIPVLSDAHIRLSESNAVLIYLSEKYGNMSLYSSIPERRAEINKWLFWESSQWQPLLTTIMAKEIGHKLLPELLDAPQSKPDWNNEQITMQCRYLESVLSEREWLAGDELSLADFSVAAMSTYFKTASFPYNTYPRIAAWLDRLSENEAWQKTEHSLWQQ